MKRKTMLILVFSSLTVATVALAARSLGGNEEDADKTTDKAVNAANETVKTADDKPVVVKTTTVKTSDLVEAVTATGVTSPAHEVTFSAEISGKVEFVSVDLGDKVRRGQVLARIDYDTLKAEKDRAEAAHNLAASTYKRLSSLGEDIVSRQQLDEAYSGMVSARAALEIAKNNVKKSVVRSNLEGIVTAKYTDRGEFATPGKPLFHVVDYSTVMVEAQLAETEVAAITEGAEALIRIDAVGAALEGKVKTVVPLADAASKTFTVRVALANPDLKILVGMSATVSLKSRVNEDVVVVPQDVVIESEAGRSVFVVDKGAAKMRPITLGPTENGRVIIASGVAPGEEVVILGHRNLVDGQSIVIAN